MKRSSERILTTHVGALHRPQDLEAIQSDTLNGRPYDKDALEKRLRSGVAEIVRKQADLGIDVVDDGEYSKSGWFAYSAERLSGFEPRELTYAIQKGKDREDFPGFYADATKRELLFYREDTFAAPPPRNWVCTGPIKYIGQELLQRDIDNFKNGLSDVNVTEAFMPVVAPGSIQPVFPNEYYKSNEEYFYAIAGAMKTEYQAIVDAGIVVQIDDAFLPYEYDRSEMSPADFRKWAELSVEALNYALEGLPEDRVRYHICWGSWNGPHSNDLPLRDIADLLLKVKAQAYSVEAANPAHEHEWKVWEDIKLPEGKIIIPGVVCHTTNVVEHPEGVAQRIERYASVVGRENVMAGTDCGFRMRSHPEIAWAKMRALSEGAALASKELWRT